MESVLNSNNQIEEKINSSKKVTKEVKTLRILLVGALVLLFIAIGVIAATLLSRNTHQNEPQSATNTEDPYNEPRGSDSDNIDRIENQGQNQAREVSAIPTDWSYFESCGVRVPVPPKTEPYFVPRLGPLNPEEVAKDVNSGRYWSASKSLLSNDPRMGEVINLSYNFDGVLGSGFVPSSVRVECTENIEGINLGEYVNQVKAIYSPTNDPTAMGDAAVIASEKSVNKWGVDAYVMTFQGGYSSPEQEYYYVANSKYLYRITSITMLDREFVKETNRLIFDNISFTSRTTNFLN